MLLAREKYLRYHPGYRSIVSKDWSPDMDSHIAIAACKGYEVTREKVVKGENGAVGYIGIFTDSLVHALRSGYWRKETMYADLPLGLDESHHQNTTKNVDCFPCHTMT